MTIQMTARGTTARDSFRKNLEKKLTKLDRFFDEDTVANVTITNEGGRETVEITIYAGGIIFRAEKTTNDRLDSLDMVVDSLFRQIIKNKTRLEKRLRKTAFEPGYEADYVGGEEKEYKIVRSKQVALKPMDVEEAILQMNLLEHDFYLFENSETDEVAVVYRRKGGNYGIMETGGEDDE
jgi:ribosomal subunit interface protein